MSMPFIDRVIRVSNVAWFKNAYGPGYTVTWSQDGEQRTEVFDSPGAAQEYAEWLDTTGSQVNAGDIAAAENALRDLERTMEKTERREAKESLRGLETTMLDLGYRPRGRISIARYKRRARKS